MIAITLDKGGHEWKELDNNHYQCVVCHIKGLVNVGPTKTHIFFRNHVLKSKIYFCQTENDAAKYPKTIRITNKKAHGIHYSNLLEGNTYPVIPNRKRKITLSPDDVWVMGKFKPVRLMPDEYEVTEYITETT